MAKGEADINDPKFWEQILANEGMPADLGAEKNGRQIVLGDGLGGKKEVEEVLEDDGSGHSCMCPINLHHALDGSINQPTDNPLESDAISAEEAEMIIDITGEILELVQTLGLVETGEMQKLRADAEKTKTDIEFKPILNTYLELAEAQVNILQDHPSVLRAQVGGILLSALMYLVTRRFRYYNETIDEADASAGNLADPQILEKVQGLFIEE